MSALDDLIHGTRDCRLSTHDWEPGQRKHMPVLLSRRLGCPIVWWPDRQKPRDECNGRHLVNRTPGPHWGEAS